MSHISFYALKTLLFNYIQPVTTKNFVKRHLSLALIFSFHASSVREASKRGSLAFYKIFFNSVWSKVYKSKQEWIECKINKHGYHNGIFAMPI